MTNTTKFALALAPAMLVLGGCATGVTADVSRFQRLSVPQGETFAVVALDPDKQGGIEFGQYANLVSARLVEEGFRPASSLADAQLLVKLDYGVDNGREKIRSSPFGFGSGIYGGGYYSRFGGYYGSGFGRRRFISGFHDPFLFGGFGYNDIDSYTVFTSDLDMTIERRANGERLFEGEASAISRSDDLPYLVPNLIEAMFTDFPGNSGERIRITVPPPPRRG